MTAADRHVEALRRARDLLPHPDAVSVLREGLRAKHARVVETAAKILRDAGPTIRGSMQDDMLAALSAWMGDGRRADPGCTAKTALVVALVRHEAERGEGVTPGQFRGLLRDAARHVAWEKVYGGRVDVAGDLRIAAAAGLVTVADPQALSVLADHLADPLLPVRRAAARNLVVHGGREAALLLRLKARIGDVEADGLGEVLRALLALDPQALDVAEAWLRAPDGEDEEATFAEAALALGEVGSDEAGDRLRLAWDRTLDEDRRRVLVTALAQVRTDKALAFLVEVVREAAPTVAADAAALLGACLRGGALRAALHEAIDARGDPALRRAAGLG